MTSNSIKIYSKLCEIYPDGLSTITELSYNSDGEKNFLISDETGFNFDLVYNCSPMHSALRKEKSPDALFIVDEVIYFIEFKEGSCKKEDIRMKIHEGITTLFCFTLKYLPEITREEFLKLDIRYAVIVRGHRGNPGDGFHNALEEASNRFNLKNLEGFLLKKTAVTYQPDTILQFLNKVTAGRVKNIGISDHNAEVKVFSLP